MIILTEIATKLENILNGTDSETSSISRGVDYIFQVATEGYHLDTIKSKAAKKNFIPVFIGNLSGEYNPIQGIGEADYNIDVSLWFPVRFKNDFYILNEYLEKCFIGSYLNYGSTSGKCVSNMSIAKYGELVGINLEKYKEWALETYDVPYDEEEMYMQMTFTLYLSTINSSYVLGNEVRIELSLFKQEGTPRSIFVNTDPTIEYLRSATDDTEIGEHTYYAFKSSSQVLVYIRDELTIEVGINVYKIIDEEATWYGAISSGTWTPILLNEQNIKFANSNIQSNTDPKGQQIMGAKESSGAPLITAYTNGFSVYIKKDSAFFAELMRKYFLGEIQDLPITITYYFWNNLSYYRQCYVANTNLNIAKGEPLTMTFAFAKKVS